MSYRAVDRGWPGPPQLLATYKQKVQWATPTFEGKRLKVYGFSRIKLWYKNCYLFNDTTKVAEIWEDLDNSKICDLFNNTA